ncbi:MAG: Flp pilus assembly protein CpaB [Bryobacterales bacterium]|nr:Flp pilus assembly protein CpaB [Bryobacteraceae bacterium]MDW8131680.1 Flp pilus assembly protein CpaB [Bryobacterales bacterium]
MERQKIVLIFGVALLAAAALTWFLWARTTAPREEAQVLAVAAARDLAPGTRIRKADLKMVRMAQAALPKGALLDAKTALDRAVLYPISANEILTSAKLASLAGPEGIPAMIEPGMRAVAVAITETSGAAGLIQPRSRVDVLFTRSGSLAEASTVTILQDVEVLSIGRSTAPGQTAGQVDPRGPRNTTATLLVTPEDARKLELAKNQGRISLALRNPLDRSRLPNGGPVTFEALDPMIFARTARARRGLPPTPDRSADLRDEEAWRRLTGEPKPQPKPEPPKPRHVVDVYRGDKHVQEIFP